MSTSDRTPPERMLRHLEKLRAAGLSTQDFFEALVGIRDDASLPAPEREALYKLIATESYIWYLEALRGGGPIDRARLHEEARRLSEESAAAIKKAGPGDFSLELIQRDIGVKD